MKSTMKMVLFHNKYIFYLITLTLSLLQLFYGICSAAESHESVKFYYYLDRDTSNQIIMKDLNSLKFRVNEPTFVIVDGFLSHLHANMTQTTKDGLFLYKPRSNLIVVDWSKLSGSNELELDENVDLAQLMFTYNKAKSKIDLVGGRLANLLHTLVENNYTDYSRMHVIGYSLGAHIAGVAGFKLMEKYNGRITRISGLDPAFLITKQNLSRRLDRSDAEFVDVYYTSRYTTGDVEHNIGHVDIFVNGGQKQPGCDFDQLISSTICNHAYSWKMWSKCMQEKCPACRCHNIECSNENGDCSDWVQVGINISMDIYGDYILKMGPLL